MGPRDGLARGRGAGRTRGQRRGLPGPLRLRDRPVRGRLLPAGAVDGLGGPAAAQGADLRAHPGGLRPPHAAAAGLPDGPLGLARRPAAARGAGRATAPGPGHPGVLRGRGRDGRAARRSRGDPGAARARGGAGAAAAVPPAGRRLRTAGRHVRRRGRVHRAVPPVGDLPATPGRSEPSHPPAAGRRHHHAADGRLRHGGSLVRDGAARPRPRLPRHEPGRAPAPGRPAAGGGRSRPGGA